MNRVYQLLLVLGCVMGLTVQAHAESLYVKSSEARVMKTPSFSATMISKLKQGSEVDVIKRSGSWVEIAYGAEQGWISKFQLGSNTPPRTTINLLDTLKTFSSQPLTFLIDDENSELHIMQARLQVVSSSNSINEGYWLELSGK